jgi:hypothetical protein
MPGMQGDDAIFSFAPTVPPPHHHEQRWCIASRMHRPQSQLPPVEFSEDLMVACRRREPFSSVVP